MTPDKLGGDITNPQSLNRYAYVDNNPASFNDPLGLFLANPQTEYAIKTTSWGWPIMYDLLSPFDVMQQPIMPNLPGGIGQVGGRANPPSPPASVIHWPQLQKLVHQNNVARSYNVCDDLIDCIIFRESHRGAGGIRAGLNAGFNPNAIGPLNYGRVAGSEDRRLCGPRLLAGMYHERSFISRGWRTRRGACDVCD